MTYNNHRRRGHAKSCLIIGYTIGLTIAFMCGLIAFLALAFGY